MVIKAFDYGDFGNNSRILGGQENPQGTVGRFQRVRLPERPITH